jgi:hypothetical protein
LCGGGDDGISSRDSSSIGSSVSGEQVLFVVVVVVVAMEFVKVVPVALVVVLKRGHGINGSTEV